MGIARRKEHKSFPEPEVAMIFRKSELESTVDLLDIEMGLRKAYQEVRCGYICVSVTCCDIGIFSSLSHMQIS